MTLKRRYRYLFVFTLSFLANCGSNSRHKSEVKESFFERKYDYKRLRIPVADDTELAAMLLHPKEEFFPGERPAIIFANSWTLTEDQYFMQAMQFAAKGYIVLSYATRGFSSSNGRVEVGSPNDINDVSLIIDWLETHTKLDLTRIGMAGLSYGAGISLLAVANEPRLKTVVALSGWGNLEQSLYGKDTIREVWLDLLLASGHIFGKLDPEIKKQVNRLRTQSEIEEVRSWAIGRSPMAYLAKINARKPPIMIANSYEDAIFPPAQMREFYEKLQGPKEFYLEKGMHTSSAIPGLLGLPSDVWTETHKWLDYWLLDLPTGIMQQPPISFQTQLGRDYFEQFPELNNKERSFKLTPINEAEQFSISKTKKQSFRSLNFIGAVDSGATSGIPLVTDTAQAALNVPIIKRIGDIDRRFAALYTTDSIKEPTNLRGAPRVKCWLAPHEHPIQLVAYLYDADGRNNGTLVTHGVVSIHKAQSEPSELQLDLNMTSYDLIPGHRLVLAIDTRDPLYASPTAKRYNVGLIQEPDHLTELTLPLAH